MMINNLFIGRALACKIKKAREDNWMSGAWCLNKELQEIQLFYR
jgi:hypothetical protein